METRHGDGTPAPDAEPALAAPPTPAPAASAAPGSVLVGRSAQGRPIRAFRVGSARARVKLLVVGSIHGNENAGRQVVARLRHVRPPRGTAIWLIDDREPGRRRRGNGQNARGVDLNRNFPDDWRAAGRPFDTYHSGSAAGSEPETQAISRFIARERPRVTLWYHQALRIVVRSDGDPSSSASTAAAGGCPAGRIRPYHGTATGWQNTTFHGRHPPSSSSFPEGAFRRERGAPRPSGARARRARSPRSAWCRRPIPFGTAQAGDARATRSATTASTTTGCATRT